MKRIYYILLLGLMVLGFTSCQDYFEDKQLDYEYTISDVRSFDYTLTDADYKTIGAQVVSRASEDDKVVARKDSAYIAKNKCFVSDDQAINCLTFFIGNKYPQLSRSSSCNVTYNLFGAGLNYCCLTDNDYKDIWDRNIPYLTPSTLDQLTSFFPTNVVKGSLVVADYEYSSSEPSPSAGTSTPFDGTPAERGYYSPSEVIAGYASGTLNDNDEISVGGTVKEWVSKNANYHNLDYWITDGTSDFEMFRSYSLSSAQWSTLSEGVATDANGVTLAIGDFVVGHGYVKKYVKSGNPDVYEFNNKDPQGSNTNCYLTTITPKVVTGASPRVELYVFDGITGQESWRKLSITNKDTTLLLLESSDYAAMGVSDITDVNLLVRYLCQEFPFAKEGQVFVIVYENDKGTTATKFIFDGVEFVPQTGIHPQTVTLSLLDNWAASLYYKNTVFSEQGDLITQNVELGGTLTKGWQFGTYSGIGYMKASGYYSATKTNYAVEMWLVTPTISLERADHPIFTFEHGRSNGPVNDVEACMSQSTVFISTDYAGDVTTCHWTELPYKKDANGDWIYPPTGYTYIEFEQDLEEYKGKHVVIGFRYKTPGAPVSGITWQIRNIVVQEAQ